MARHTPPDVDTRPDALHKQLGIRVPVQLSDQLEAIAKREHNGVAAVCRRLLASALASHEQDAAR
jgi:hypothetical protein